MHIAAPVSAYVPFVQGICTFWSVDGQWLPAVHFVHWDCPPVLKLPGSQGTGEAAGSLQYEPAGHARHADAGIKLNVPLAQFIGAASFLEQSLPAGHGVHKVLLAFE